MSANFHVVRSVSTPITPLVLTSNPFGKTKIKIVRTKIVPQIKLFAFQERCFQRRWSSHHHKRVHIQTAGLQQRESPANSSDDHVEQRDHEDCCNTRTHHRSESSFFIRLRPVWVELEWRKCAKALALFTANLRSYEKIAPHSVTNWLHIL